jgi:hypothetical protein
MTATVTRAEVEHNHENLDPHEAQLHAWIAHFAAYADAF